MKPVTARGLPLLALLLWFLAAQSHLSVIAQQAMPTHEIDSLYLASIFTDHAVIQRDQPIAIWGRAVPGSTVRVSLGNHRGETRANESGAWQVTLEPLSAGGPLELFVRDERGTEIRREVSIGDVFLCSGQSNMQWTLADTLPGEEEFADITATSRIYLYLLPKEGASEPRIDIAAEWKPLDPTSAPPFSAVALYFMKALRNSGKLGDVPIGLIDASCGGTRVEAWISPGSLAANHGEEAVRESMFGWKPSSMYNGLIAPLVPYGIRGVLWYQGESNSAFPDQYERLLTGMIADWRTQWDRPELPFVIVQLPNFAEWFDGGHFTWIREAQANVAARVPHVSMIVTIDTTDGFDLHPKTKRLVGERLALATLADIYGFHDVNARGPVVRSTTVAEGQIVVEFESPDGLVLRPGYGAFEIASADGVFYPATATLDGDKLRIYNPAMATPLFVRYAWRGNPPVLLYDANGLPAAPFRTDHRPHGAAEFHRLPAPWKYDNGRFAIIISGDGRLDSFRVGTAEFIDATDPMLPGGWLASVWGPIRLLIHERTREDTLLCYMESGSIAYRFSDTGVSLTAQNPADLATPLCLRLARDIEVEQPAESAIHLHRQGASLEITASGPLKIDRRDDDTVVISVEIAPKDRATMNISVPQENGEEVE